MKKCICLIISQIVECDKPQETIYKGQKDFLTFNVEVIISLFKTKEVVENKNFREEGNFLVYKYICPVFSQAVECDKPQETIYKGQKDFLTITVEVIRSFFKTKEVVENTNF